MLTAILPRLTLPWTRGPNYTALPARHHKLEGPRPNIATGPMPVITYMHKWLLRTFSLSSLVIRWLISMSLS